MFASEVMDQSASLLNDQAKATFTYTNMLPYLSMANDEAIIKLANNGVSPLKQTSAVATINVGTALFPLPADLLLPESLLESDYPVTSPVLYVPMKECKDLPEEAASSLLRFWAYRNLQLQIGPANSAGALTIRSVKLYYTRVLTALTASGSVVEIAISKTFLSQRTASLSARYIGENDSRADELDVICLGQNKDGENGSLGELVNLFTRNLQGVGVRRKGFHRRRR